MSNPQNEILDNVLQLILPKYTTDERNLLVADVGTIIYNTTTNKINICKNKSTGAGSWEAVSSS